MRDSETNHCPVLEQKIVNLIRVADNSVLRKVLVFLNRDNAAYDRTLNIMESIGLPRKNAKEILDFSLETNDFHLLSSYMENRTLTFEKLSEMTDFCTAVQSVMPGLSSQFILWLLNYMWVTKPSMGAGEVALSLLLKDGNKPRRGGDIGIGDQRIIEAKGVHGRLMGQNGFGRGIQAGTIFHEAFSELMEKVPTEHQIAVPKPGGAEYQTLKTTRTGWIMNNLAKVCITHGAANKIDVVNIWKKALSAVFIDMKMDWIEQFISDSGEVLNISGFLETWLIESVKYYQSIDKFEAIFLVNNEGRFIVIETKDFDKLPSLVKWSPPSFRLKAGNQGIVFGISVK